MTEELNWPAPNPQDAPHPTVYASRSGVGAGVVIGLQVMWEGNGGSPFRRGISVLIVDQNTFQPIGPWRAIVRIIVANFSLLFFGLGFLWMLWDENSQTWHDKAAGSVVVKR